MFKTVISVNETGIMDAPTMLSQVDLEPSIAPETNDSAERADPNQSASLGSGEHIANLHRDGTLFLVGCKCLAMYDSVLLAMGTTSLEIRDEKQRLLKECVCLLLFYKTFESDDAVERKYYDETFAAHLSKLVDYYFKTLAYQYSATGIKQMKILNNTQREELIDAINYLVLVNKGSSGEFILEKYEESNLPHVMGYHTNVIFKMQMNYWTNMYILRKGYSSSENLLCDFVHERNKAYNAAMWASRTSNGENVFPAERAELGFELYSNVRFQRHMDTQSFEDAKEKCVYPYSNNNVYQIESQWLSFCLLPSKNGTYSIMDFNYAAKTDDTSACNSHKVIFLKDFTPDVPRDWHPYAELSLSFPENILTKTNLDSAEICCVKQTYFNMCSEERLPLDSEYPEYPDVEMTD